MFNEAFWVGLSFVIFMALFVKFFGRMILRMLDKRAANIQDNLDEALRLKEEAQALLSSFQRQQKEIEKEAQEIVVHAEEEASHIINQAEKNLDENLNKRIEIAMSKISGYEASILQEIRSNAVDSVINTVHTLITKHMSPEMADMLVEQAMQEANKKLN